MVFTEGFFFCSSFQFLKLVSFPSYFLLNNSCISDVFIYICVMSKQPNTLYTSAVKIWFEFYEHKTGEQYVFDGKDGAHLKGLIKKIQTKLLQKSMESNDEMVLSSLRGLLFSISDPWILEHLEISIINSKFNVAYAKAKRTNPFTAGDRIDDIIARRHSEGAG